MPNFIPYNYNQNSNEQGLSGHDLFAIDGYKMSSDTSKEWSGTIK